MNYLEIESVVGREILDSRGNPTVEAEITLADGTVARGCAPSGASTGEFEALELRDGDKSRYLGKGVTKAVENINTVIADAVVGLDASDIYAVDAAMRKADGTKTSPIWRKRHSGRVHRRLPRSRRFAGDAAVSFSGRRERQPPARPDDEHPERRRTRHQHRGYPGVHDHARGCPLLQGALRWCAEVFHALASILKAKGLATSVGDEGGFAPNLSSDEETIETILAAIEKAGYQPARTSCWPWMPLPPSGRAPRARASTSCPRQAPSTLPAS